VPPRAAEADPVADEASRLRGERIPQLVGMAVAARVLARDLARELAAGARELADGRVIQEHAGCDEATARKVSAALSGWLLERAARIAARCEERATRWIAEAHRAEGHAEAIEGRSSQGPAPCGTDPAPVE
jgi:uncharacterized protein YbjQ (UPF0145 family)